jgi:hypothetical protein
MGWTTGSDKTPKSMEVNMDKVVFCFVTGEVIPAARVEVLRSWGIPEDDMTSLEGAKALERSRYIVPDGDGGTMLVYAV